MLAGEVVVAVEEEGPGELQAHAHELGSIDEYRPEGGDCIVVARVLDRGHAGAEQIARPVGSRAEGRDEKKTQDWRKKKGQSDSDCPFHGECYW